MDTKKEVQETITRGRIDFLVSDEEFLGILRLVAPGTNMRSALNGSLKIGKGALVAVENPSLNSLIDGGFRINARFTPQKFMELSKMDGAIILSKDMKKIVYANVTLVPDSQIKSAETGTRHKAAERTAKQTGSLVIAISERRNETTLYYKNARYPILPTEELLRKTNESVQILEKQRELFDKNVSQLTKHELRNQQSVLHAAGVIQKGILIQKILGELHRCLIELGREGILMRTRIKEITEGVEKETTLVLKDYSIIPLKKSLSLLEMFSYDDILDKGKIIHSLGYDSSSMVNRIKGWRLLSKTSLSDSEIAALLSVTGNLGATIHSNPSLYRMSLGEERARIFSEEINKIKFDLSM
ncbi:MAG: DNA integrity scanning diadenylate cyclase DisA [archaeon]